LRNLNWEFNENVTS